MAQTVERATEKLVRSIPEPEFTKSWHPVSHGKVIDALELSVKNIGLKIVDRHYSLRSNGLNMFGTWWLDNQHNGTRWMVGLRNSMCKAFAIGICAGTLVTVCSNMMFSGEFIEVRRHTAGVDLEELRILAGRAVDGISTKLEDIGKWHIGLKEHTLNEDEYKILTYDALDKDVIPLTRFNEFKECHEEEMKLNDRSLYTFHGGVTRMVRDTSLFNITRYSENIKGFCDDYMIQKAA